MLFTIMHIYEVAAKNQYEATDELMTARKNHFDKVFLKKVIVKDAEPKLPRDKVNVFEDPKKPARWGTIFSGKLPATGECLPHARLALLGRGKHSQIGGESYGKIFSQSGNSDCLHHRRIG